MGNLWEAGWDLWHKPGGAKMEAQNLLQRHEGLLNLSSGSMTLWLHVLLEARALLQTQLHRDYFS